MIVLILMQHGKGADAGAAFGSGASGTVFGARGSGNFLSRTTAMLATVFFLNSIALAWMVSNRTTASNSIMNNVAQEAAPAAEQSAPAPEAAAPAAPTDAPAAPAVEAAPVTEAPAAPAASATETPAAPAAPAAEGAASEQKRQ